MKRIKVCGAELVPKVSVMQRLGGGTFRAPGIAHELGVQKAARMLAGGLGRGEKGLQGPEGSTALPGATQQPQTRSAF